MFRAQVAGLGSLVGYFVRLEGAGFQTPHTSKLLITRLRLNLDPEP